MNDENYANAFCQLAFVLGAAALAEAKTQQVLYYTPPAEGFVWDWLLSFRHTYPYSYVGASMEYDGLATLGGEARFNLPRGCRPPPAPIGRPIIMRWDRAGPARSSSSRLAACT